MDTSSHIWSSLPMLVSPANPDQILKENIMTVGSSGQSKSESNENIAQNQSNSYLLGEPAPRSLNLFEGVPIPERKIDTSYKPRPLPQTVYPPTKIPDMFLESAGADALVRGCCTCWVVIGVMGLIFYVIILGIMFHNSKYATCCGGTHIRITVVSIAFAVYFLISICIFASVHGSDMDLPTYGQCKELVLKLIHFIILLSFLGVILWINSNVPTASSKKKDDSIDDCEPTCPAYMLQLFSAWVYLHLAIIIIRIIALLLLPNTKMNLSPPPEIEEECADPDVQRIINTIKTQRQVMNYPSTSSILIRKQLNSQGDK